MLKIRQTNKGYTLVELIVSIAILAFIGIAIGGLMSSNTVIFRKSKADLDIQNISQDAFNRVTNDVMQARAVYIEGYTTGTAIPFGTNLYGGSYSGTATPIKCLVDSDINLMSDYGTVPTTSTLITKSKGTFADAAAKKKFNSYFYKIRYMTDEERDLYEKFIDDYGSDSATPFKSLKTASGGGSTKYTYKDVYVTKMVLMYLTPYDSRYDKDSDAPSGTVYDQCTVIYEFVDGSKAAVKVKTDYKYMEAINNDDVFTEYLNYKDLGGTIVPGVVAQIDGENNSIGLKMYFNKAERDNTQGRKFNSEGMIKLRNSNVLNDAK